jgi:hypothetical protein
MKNAQIDSNPFLEVLPARLQSMDFFKKMRKLPPSINDQLPRDPTRRKAILNEVLHNWFHVNSLQFDVYERLVDVITEGYRLRGQEGSSRILKNTIEWHDHGSNPDYIPPRLSKRPVDGFSLIGVSGLGKSLLVETILEKCFVQTFKHKFTTQVVYLKMNCTSIGSTKSLCHSFFEEMDIILGTDYFNKYLNSRYNAEKLIAVMANVAARHHLGVLIIDEINHLVHVKGQSKDQILNFLKNLNASIGVPIVYIGTPEAFPILRGNFQQARRTQGIGAVIWDRYKEEDPEWERLLKSLWKNQVMKKPGELTNSLKQTYYNLSQGILDPLVKLHVSAQKRALQLGLESIDGELLKAVAKDDFGFTNPILNALRINDVEILSIYRDVSVSKVHISNHIEKLQTSRHEELQRLLSSEFTDEEVKTCMELILERFPKLKPKQLLEQTTQVLEHVSAHKLPRNKIKKSATGLLVRIGEGNEKNDSNIHNRLKQAGVIKPLGELILNK